MQIRSPRNVLAAAAVVALTVGALSPVSAFAKGPGSGNGGGGGGGAAAADCGGDCPNDGDQAQLQTRTRDGSGDQAQARSRQGRSDVAKAGAAVKVRAGQGQNAQSGGQGRQAQRQAQGQGQGQGRQAQGQGGAGINDETRGPGNCDECADIEPGTLTPEQEATLAFMADEEKLAHDLYVALGALYPEESVFARIAQSEARHQAAVRTVMERYGTTDPTAGFDPGKFFHPEVQALYDQLWASAQAGVAEALAAGVAVETEDIADLKAAIAALGEGDELEAPDVLQMYQNLLAASERHLGAFTNRAA
jgi:hypothetical protein